MKSLTPWLIIALIGSLIGLSFAIKSCNDNKNAGNKYKALAEYNAGKIDSLKNVKGQTVVIQTPAVTSDRKLIDSIAQANFKLSKSVLALEKQVQVFTKIVGDFQISQKFIPYLVDTGTKYYALDSNTIHVPTRATDSNASYSIAVEVQKKGINVESLIVHDTLSVKVVEMKGSIFKAPKISIQAINSNPDVHITEQHSVILQPKTGAWNEWIKPLLVGIVTAVEMVLIL